MSDHRLFTSHARRGLRLGPAPERLTTSRGFGTHRTGSRLMKAAAVLAALVVAMAVAAAGGYALYLSRVISLADPAEAARLQTELAGSAVQANNILVVGIDSAKGSTRQANAIVLVHTDSQDHRVWELWLPPDIGVVVPGHGETPLGSAPAAAGAAGMVRAVRQLTGLRISQYVEVDAGALPTLVDALGGVWVDVPADIAASSPGGALGAGHSALVPGRQELTGQSALALGTATLTVDPDYARARDQGLVLDALANSVAGNPSAGFQLIGGIARHLKTTMGLGQFVSLWMSMRNTGPGSVYEAVVPGKLQAGRITPDSAPLARLAADMRGERPFDVPQATLARAAADAGVAASSRPPSSVTVTVNNGAGLSGAAGQAAGLLRTQGFAVASVGNANLSVYPHTLVVFKADRTVANLVAKYLPPGVSIVPSRGLYAFKTDILVVIGKDWDITKAPVTRIISQ